MRHVNIISHLKRPPEVADSLLVKQQQIELLGQLVGVLAALLDLIEDLNGKED